MIAILDYNNSESALLNEIINTIGIDYKYTLSENILTNSDKIILPHPHYFISAYKKMQLKNLFSYLRLIKKPILGINDGFCFMCDEVLNHSKCGLGFFQVDLNSLSTASHLGDDNELVEGEIYIGSNCSLLDKSLENSIIKFNSHTQIRECEYSTSTIKYNDEVFSLTCEFKNYYSCEVNFDKNKEVGNSILKNFLLL